MSKSCTSCKKTKVTHTCEICKDDVCKSCVEFLDDKALLFVRELAHKYPQGSFCPQCFDSEVGPLLLEFNSTMERAREVIVFTKEQSKETSRIKRKEPPLEIQDCEDEEETLLRLAYLAAEKDFNCILDYKVSTRKIIVGSHKKTVFSASGIPTNYTPRRYD